MFVLSSIQYIRNNDLLFIFKRPFALSNYESTIKLYFNTDRLINPFHETTNYFPHYLKFHYYYYYIYHLTIDNEKRKYHPRKNTQLFFDHSLKKKKEKKIHQKIENFEKNPPLPIYRRAACSTRRDQIMQIGKRLRDATRPTPAAQYLSFIRGYGPIYKGRA